MSLKQLPLAPLRWEEVVLDLSGLAGPEELLQALTGSLDALHRRIGPTIGEARAVGCRVFLTGSTTFHGELRAELARGDVEALRCPHDEVIYFVEKVIDRSMPALDLERLAAGDDPPAFLARQLLGLRSRDDASLLREAGRRLARVTGEPWWGQLGPVQLGEDRVRELLFAAGMRALEELLRQAPAGPGKSGT